MRVRDRCLLFIGGLLFTLLFAAVAAIAGYPMAIRPEQVAAFWQTIIASQALRLCGVGVSLLFVLYSLRLVWISLPFAQRPVDEVRQETEIGPICISRKTLESLVLRQAKQVKGARDLSVRVRLQGKKPVLRIFMKINVDGERPIPELTAELQERVKEQIASFTGLEVNDVTVKVARTIKTDRGRVRVK